MSFSVTGDILTGSIERPDLITFVYTEVDKNITKYSLDISSSINKLNKLGYIPGVSTITGLVRSLLGVVHTIIHLACSILSANRGWHLKEAKLGARNIGRGVFETIPIIGNITMFIRDSARMSECERIAKKQVEKNVRMYDRYVATFFNGQEIAKCLVEKLNEERRKLANPPSLTECARIIRRIGQPVI
jgi:hypothetical protein